MSTPENTSTRDPLTHMVGALGGMTDYITGMESAGQRQLVASDTLPAKAPWDELEVLGFVPGEPVPGDDLFRRCTLPAGWKREGSDHAMWSHVVDERGVKRVAIFYKAAFYDRDAFARIANVGGEFATEAIYGDGAPMLPAQWAVLTKDERTAFRDSLTRYIEEQAKYPSRESRVSRAEFALELATSSPEASL